MGKDFKNISFFKNITLSFISWPSLRVLAVNKFHTLIGIFLEETPVYLLKSVKRG